MQLYLSIQTEDFDLNEQLGELNKNPRVGAVVTFTGLVREMAGEEQALIAMELEHYPGMTEKVIRNLIDEAHRRWPLIACRVIHRVGRLHTGANIVFVGVSSEHRHNAYQASNFLMDHLKTQAPFWKKEISEHSSQWLATKDSDHQAMNRWHPKGKQSFNKE